MYTGRLAPSPTGYLHLGHAATFLRAAQRAREGRLLLRVDDLDPQRSRAVYAEATRDDLHWLGITWHDEAWQSQRLPLYRAAVERLVAAGLCYPCTCSRKDLQQAAAAPHEETDDEPVYSGRCRPAAALFSVPEIEDVNLRFRVPEGEAVRFTDVACGPQQFQAGRDFGDFLVWRRDGLPSYQLACVVDDAEMRITEVVRGRDLLKSTARQILLQHALGVPTPRYLHTALLRDERGERLAKRHDALSLRALREAGVSASETRERALARVASCAHHTT